MLVAHLREFAEEMGLSHVQPRDAVDLARFWGLDAEVTRVEEAA